MADVGPTQASITEKFCAIPTHQIEQAHTHSWSASSTRFWTAIFRLIWDSISKIGFCRSDFRYQILDQTSQSVKCRLAGVSAWPLPDLRSETFTAHIPWLTGSLAHGSFL